MSIGVFLWATDSAMNYNIRSSPPFRSMLEAPRGNGSMVVEV